MAFRLRGEEVNQRPHKQAPDGRNQQDVEPAQGPKGNFSPLKRNLGEKLNQPTEDDRAKTGAQADDDGQTHDDDRIHRQEARIERTEGHAHAKKRFHRPP
ncbi:MAG: hypothetical protein ACE5IM_04870 [Nitrospinota bacterium]